MHEYTADIIWSRGDQVFVDNRYSRRHLIRFDSAIELPASSSPHVVRVPFSDPTAVDPEELLVASLSSCHMLSFLYLAAGQKFRVDHYADHASGVLEKDAVGKTFVSVVTLRPDVRFSGDRLPTKSEIEQLHHHAHDACFIANSVRTEVRCEPVSPPEAPDGPELAGRA
jgi:organic hydroperoxide reductase OsmC/OhrA